MEVIIFKLNQKNSSLFPEISRVKKKIYHLPTRVVDSVSEDILFVSKKHQKNINTYTNKKQKKLKKLADCKF